MNCPTCKSTSVKVIYMGIPVRLCWDEDCATVFGFWAWLMDLIPFNGYFMKYDGSYPAALWHWLTNWPAGEGE